MGKNYLIKGKAMTAFLIGSLVTAPVLAEKSKMQFMNAFDVEAEINMSVLDNENGKSSDVWEAQIGIGVNLTEFLKANFTLEMSNDIDEFEDLLEEAYFVLDFDQFGVPMIHAIRIGQFNVDTFGQQKQAIPRYKDHLLYSIETAERKVGATFYLDSKLLAKLVDELNVSVYKTGDGDFMSTDGDTVAVAQVKKALQNLLQEGSQLNLQASVRHEQKSDQDDEIDVSLSADYTIGRWNAYAQVILMDSDDTTYALNSGASYQLLDNLAIGGDVAYIEDLQTDATLYLKWTELKNIEISPYVTRKAFKDDSQDDDTEVGVNFKVSADQAATGVLLKK